MSDKKITIGHLLDDNQRALLTDTASALTKAELHDMQKNPSLDGKLNQGDRDSLRKLAVHRANSGQTILTYSHMALDTDEDSSEDDGGGFQSNW